MDSYRVLHLIDHMGPGGAQRLVRGVVLSYENHYALALRKKGDGQFWEGLVRFRQPGSRMRATALAQFATLPSLLRRERIDVLHCHLNFSWLAGIGLSRLLKKRGIQVIFHEHDPNEINARVYRRILAGASKHGKVIAISQHVQARLVALGVPDESIERVPNYVSASLFTPNARTRTDVTGREFTVGFAGRLVARKGWRHFLDTAKLLDGSGVQFQLAGDGADRKAVEQRIRSKGLGKKVKVLGHVTDMAAFYRGIDVVLMPVTAEPMGLVQLEAQAAGVPVVAFNVEGITETLTPENAMLVAPGDIEGLAAAVRQLQAQPELYERLSRAGQENARRYSFERYMQRLDAIYRQVMG